MHPYHIHPSISRTRIVVGHLSEVLSSLVETLTVPVQLLLGGLRDRDAELAGHTCDVGASEVAEDAEIRDGNVESAQGVGDSGAVEVELLHISVVERAHLVGTGIHDPDDASLSVSSQTIGINTKILNLAREA